MSRQEIYAWTSFASTISILGFYILYFLGASESIPSLSGHFSSIFIKIIGIAFVIEIILGILDSREKVSHDERDDHIAAKGYKNAYWFLSVCVVLILGQVFISGIIDLGSYTSGVFNSPFLLFHVLFIALMMSSLINRGTQLYFYRKEF